MLEPASPSTPPPPRPAEKPLTFFSAAMWVLSAHIVFLWLALMTIALREAASRDLLSQLMCQLVAYGLALFLMLRVHAPDSTIRRFVGWRFPRPVYIVLAAIAGFAAAPPAAWLLGQLEQAFPSNSSFDTFAEIFNQAGTIERVAIGAGVIVIGPLAEELIFRGAIFGPLLEQRTRPRAVIVFSAALFALVHHDPRRMAPIFLIGLLLGLCRYASRSVIPGFALHMCFNAIPIAGLLFSEMPPNADPTNEAVDPSLALGGLVLTIACAIATARLGRNQSDSDRGPTDRATH